MQLDIFDDSRDVMLRNDVLAALQHYNPSGAKKALQRLAGEYPDDQNLPDLATLADALGRRSTDSFPDHPAAAQARHTLTHDVQPAAVRLLGERAATTWLAPLWTELAIRAAALPFRADQADTHAAALWLQAGRWVEADNAVTRIESWRRIPVPLMWMTEARYRAAGLEAVWPLLAELAWLSPSRLDSLLKRLNDSSVNALRKAFDASFEGTGELADLAWLPAWVLCAKTGLAPLVKQAVPSRDGDPERATRLMIELLSLERQGRHHELIERRRELRDLNGSLYAEYMKTR
jgi:hypothetical protein